MLEEKPFPLHLIDEAGEALPAAAVEFEFYSWLKDGAGPDDWHSFAQGVNWGAHNPELYEWIVSSRECDRATALLFFWKSAPESDLELYEQDSSYVSDSATLQTLIISYWAAGYYKRSDIEFNLFEDTWWRDFEGLDNKFGPKSEQVMPKSMRVDILGRAVKCGDTIEGIPSRFWPAELR